MQARAVPGDAVRRRGYELALHGFNQWNGVAIASRSPIESVETSFPGMPGFVKGVEGPDQPQEARAIGATIDGVRLWSLYVPNGRALGDPHYFYKLDWIAALTEYARAQTTDHPEVPFALMGDFNIAPFDVDNGDPTVVVGQTTHVSPPEREAFFTLENSGVTDVVRARVPEGLFTYWDYKQLRFPRNEGMRIDFILGLRAVRRRGHGCLDPPQRAQGQRAVRPRAGARRPRPVEGRRRPADDLRLRHPGPLADAGLAGQPGHANGRRSGGATTLVQVTTSPHSVLGDSFAGATLDDRYRLDGLIGRGGMASVYRGVDLSLGAPSP